MPWATLTPPDLAVPKLQAPKPCGHRAAGNACQTKAARTELFPLSMAGQVRGGTCFECAEFQSLKIQDHGMIECSRAAGDESASWTDALRSMPWTTESAGRR